MSTEEKAKQLTDKFRPMFYGRFSIPAKKQAMKCVLILIDEILNNSKDSIPILDYSPDIISNEGYWKKVKEEINNSLDEIS